MVKNSFWKSDEHAFTLIETAVAILILTIGLLALAQLFVLSTYTNTFAYDESIEVKAAEDTIELLRGLQFTDPRLSPGGTIRADVAACDTGCAADQNHILGVYFNPVTIGSPSVTISYAMATDVYSTTAGSNWSKRQYEIRWQAVGYPSTPPTAGTTPQFMAFNAYDDTFPVDPTATMWPPTPADAGGQTSLIVIVRVVPVGAKGAARLAKRVQLATILSRPS